jgi:hypothetical protein
VIDAELKKRGENPTPLLTIKPSHLEGGGQPGAETANTYVFPIFQRKTVLKCFIQK